jgi:hypothetical protein
VTIDQNLVILAAVALGAAIVNGALGYGFSSITVPIALLMFSSRVLNPALVLVEVPLNLYVLVVNRRSVPAVFRRVSMILLGLVPGVVVGSLLLAHLVPGYVKLITYAVLLPLILVQAAGLRWPIQGAERKIGLPFGAGLGILYSVTTISGPPLALLFNNQGYEKRDFRAALGIVRTTESAMTALAYFFLQFYTSESLALLPFTFASILVGVPIGGWLIRRISVETFRRVCMSFDAWIVGFGLSRVLPEVRLADLPQAYLVLLAVVVLDAVLLYRYFGRRSGRSAPASSPQPAMNESKEAPDITRAGGGC